MRITYIHQHFRFPHEAGGQRPWEFARRLCQDGHQVRVICSGDTPLDSYIEGIRVTRLKTPYDNQMSALARTKSFLAFMIASTGVALRTPADIVFASSTPLTTSIPGLLASRVHRTRFVFEVRDLWPSVPARLGYLHSRTLLRAAQWLEAATYRAADAVVTLSPSMSEGVLQTFPLANVHMVPNACDREAFTLSASENRETRHSLGWTKPVILYAGSFGATYRIPWIIRLAGATDSATVHIIGAGQATPSAEKLSTALGLDPAQVLPGRLPKTEVVRRLSACDLVLSSIEDHPALHGNSLNKVFDALAAGKPILFNHGGWLSDLVIQSGAGFRLPPDPIDAAKSLERLIEAPDRIRSAAAAARELAVHFDRNRLYQEFKSALLGGPDAEVDPSSSAEHAPETH